MGGWFSSFLTLKTLLYPPKQLAIHPIADPNPDPFVLLSAAAEIAALHRRMEDSAVDCPITGGRMLQGDAGQSSANYDDTDLEDSVTSLLRDEKDETSSSDEDESSSTSCPRMLERRHREIFEMQRKMTFRGRMFIGNREVCLQKNIPIVSASPYESDTSVDVSNTHFSINFLYFFQTFQELREDILCLCHGLTSASTSIAKVCCEREICRPRGGSSMTLGAKTSILNQFLPNCRRIVDKLRSKSFCCSYIKGGTELVVSSQDEFIRFFEQRGPRDRYQLKNAIRVPITTWSILDVAVNRQGDALCYGTWKDSVFFARLSECTADNPTGASWTELPVPSQDASMAIFSLRFSRRGHEVLCGGSDRNLHIYDLGSMSRVVTIPDAHADDINAVCYGDTDSNLLYSGGDDGLVKVYDRRAFGELDYQPVGVFAGHRDGITYIDARGDDRYLLSNSKDQTIKLWDLRRFSNEETVRKTVNCVRQQSWDYRWQPAPPCSLSPLKGDTSVITLRGHSVLHTLVRAKFSPSRTGKQFIYTGCARGEVVIYDLLANSSSSPSESSSSPVCRRLPGHVAVVRDVDWNPSSNEIATCAWDGVTAIWKWDERHDHITSSEVNRIGAEDSCDESYQPVVKRRKAAQRRSKCTFRRRQSARSDEASDSPNPELLYTF
ncbi:DDB1- and CUL4-associated factor 11 [Trichostrongylus colubriformis]|uniref:DDB1- and CUL4-associated factor 11 n=1 Tax=Trichostrongylus colubriformis TaxID=6319 RepID=A0AAN8FFB8_TRICO